MFETIRLTLSAGPLMVHDSAGDGPTIVLVHGALVDHRLWDGVAAGLAPDHRVIAPDLPLGAHTLALREPSGATPPGVATMIVELLEALDLEDVTLVGNDTGGALCQLVAARRPRRLGRLALTSCDAFDHFPPPLLRPLPWIARVPGATAGAMALTRSARLTRLLLTPLATGFDAALAEAWMAPARELPGVRRDLTTLVRGMHPQLTREAASALAGWTLPAAVAWGERDPLFPRADGQRLAELLGARFELLPGARTLTPLDAPERLAELIRELAGRPAGQPAAMR